MCLIVWNIAMYPTWFYPAAASRTPATSPLLYMMFGLLILFWSAVCCCQTSKSCPYVFLLTFFLLVARRVRCFLVLFPACFYAAPAVRIGCIHTVRRSRPVSSNICLDGHVRWPRIPFWIIHDFQLKNVERTKVKKVWDKLTRKHIGQEWKSRPTRVLLV